ncbi:hypothetical protein OC844_006146 [Tilletia horrida]|nr:hypothetical protein OC844_006146 [Tilletia horrida]
MRSAAPASSSSASARGPREITSLSLDNFKCEFLIDDGQPVPLYGIRKDGNTVNCFVEAEEGKSFAVKLSPLTRETRQFRTALLLGGHSVKSYSHEGGTWQATFKSRSVGYNQEQSFLFAKPLITDDDKTSVRDPAEAAKLCEVTCKVEKVRHIHRVEGPPRTESIKSTLVPEKAIYEKSKKVGSVGFSAGPAQVIAPLTHHTRCCVDPDFEPILFHFRCITRTGLQIMHLIPLDVEDAEEKAARKAEERAKRAREEEEIEREEQQLQKRLKEIEKRRAALQDANTSSSSSNNNNNNSLCRVKQEPQRFDFSQGGDCPANALELSDLDDDDDD